MYRITRIVAVLLLALAPVIGAETVQAQTRDAWPIYPSMYFSSTLCQFAGGSGSAFVNCAPGGQMVSQIDSSYQCNQINVSETGYEAGPVSLTTVTNDGLNSQSITIDGNGTWYIQIPGPFPLNAVVLEFSLPDGGGFLLPTIYSSPCPVATSTPTSAPSNTPNPSDTPTATVNPSYTVTPIPTHTPLPSGHSTFTATRTPTAGPTSTPAPAGNRDCGDVTFPLLNCDWNPQTFGANATHWTNGDNGPAYQICGGSPPVDFVFSNNFNPNATLCSQNVVAQATGNLYVEWNWSQIDATPTFYFQLNSGSTAQFNSCPHAYNSAGPYCISSLGAVVSGTNYTFRLGQFSDTGQRDGQLWINRVWVSSTPNTPTPGPTSTATATVAGSPTATPYVNPFWTPTPGPPGSPIPTDTECPGGCAVAALTGVPGVSTIVTVDTNPFSPLTHLSLSRSPCTPFGYVQIPYPVITGTPALGQPLQFGWTAPITHTWDDTNIITNTAIQPCAMAKEVTPYVWDFTYWGSGVALAIVFTIWLIGWVGRLSGDHTVDG